MTPDESKQLAEIHQALGDMHKRLFDPEKGILDKVSSLERRQASQVGFMWLWAVLSSLFGFWTVKHLHS